MGRGRLGWWLDLVTMNAFSNQDGSVSVILWTRSCQVPWVRSGIGVAGPGCGCCCTVGCSEWMQSPLKPG